MKDTRMCGIVCLSVAIAAVGIGCKAGTGSGMDAYAVKVDGSSTVFPMTKAVADEFQHLHARARVAVGVSGTGGGFRKFCRGETDISAASRPITQGEAEQCQRSAIEYIELPIAYDGLAVLVNPKNTWANEITTNELKAIWEPEAQGKMTLWSQIRTSWPPKEIHLYGAGADSGTYDYFTEAIVHREHASRSDYTASEDDTALVQGVANDELALGFFGYVYYHENKTKLKALAIDDGKPENGDGPILPSVDAVRAGTYQPLARPLFLYVSKPALAHQEVDAFVGFYMSRTRRIADETGYVPLPDMAYGLARQRLMSRRTGSVFGGKGSQVGVAIETLLAKEQED